MADRNEVTELPVRVPQLSDAVRVALIKALRAGADGKEWGGAIFQRGHEFYASNPQSSDQSAKIGVTVKKDQPADVLAAIYHTHPRGKDSDRFSPDDVRVAQNLKVPSFVGVTQDGNALVFDPSVDRADRVDPRRRNAPGAGSARGREYLKSALLAQAVRMVKP